MGEVEVEMLGGPEDGSIYRVPVGSTHLKVLPKQFTGAMPEPLVFEIERDPGRRRPLVRWKERK